MSALVNFIATALEIPMTLSGKRMEDDGGQINRKALGYVYGFIDAALRQRGLDIANPAIGVPVTHSVLNCLFEGRATPFTDFLLKHLGKDQVLMLGVMHGGQQYLDWANSNGQRAPLGLGKFITEGDAR
jgi:hypothetical protein